MSGAALLASGLFNATFFAQWIDFQHSLHAQHFCSNASETCLTTAHFTFVIGPELGDRQLDKVTCIGLDADGVKPLGYTNWENHVVNGVCLDPDFKNCSSLPGNARVFNWGYESRSPLRNVADLAPSITMKVRCGEEGWLRPITLPSVTIPCVKTIVSGRANSKQLSLLPNKMSTCAYQDGDDVIAHVVFSVAPVDDPIEELKGTGEYSMDGGATWANDGNVFFEDHIDLKNGTYMQSWQYDFRRKRSASSVCYRIMITDRRQRSVKYESCMHVCKSVVPFHNAAGYCPSSDVPSGVLV